MLSCKRVKQRENSANWPAAKAISPVLQPHSTDCHLQLPTMTRNRAQAKNLYTHTLSCGTRREIVKACVLFSVLSTSYVLYAYLNVLYQYVGKKTAY